MISRLVDMRIALLTAVDYDGNQRTLGGDPVTVKLIGPLEETQNESVASNLGCQQKENDYVHVMDHKNGKYTIRLRLSTCGRYVNKNKLYLINQIHIIVCRYRLNVCVLGRPVPFNGSNGHNIEFSVTKNIDPTCQYNIGPSMKQPAAIVVNQNTARVRK